MPAIDTTAIRNSVTKMNRSDALSHTAFVLRLFGLLGLLTAATTGWAFAYIVVMEVLTNAATGPLSAELLLYIEFTFTVPLVAILATTAIKGMQLVSDKPLIELKRPILIVEGVFFAIYAVRLILLEVG
jgi:hypothetical protein